MTNWNTTRRTKSRISRIIDREGLILTLTPRRHIPALLFLTVWLTIWSIGGVFAGTELINDWHKGGFDNMFLLVWMVGWAIGWYFAARQVLWSVFGKERLIVSNRGLVQQVSILLFSRTKAFDAGFMSDLQWQKTIEKNSDSISLYGKDTGVVQFMHADTLIKVAKGCSQEEGGYLIEEILRWVPIKEA